MRIAEVVFFSGAVLWATPSWGQPSSDPAQSSGAAAVVEDATQQDMQAPPAEPTLVAPTPDEPATVPAPDAPAPASNLEDFRHKHQVSLRATFGKGYRLAFAYGEGEVCGENGDETPCYTGSPAFADLDLSFGLTDGLELSALVRLGLESEWTGAPETTRPLTLGLGIRAYADPPARVKVFVGARVLYDLTEAGAAGKNDLAIRAEPGLQVEIVRYVALYVQAGATIGFLRWLRFEVDGGGGIQLRIP